MPTVFATQEALRGAAGTDLGVTDWLTITQERINQFADATGDHQWIHVDPERAKDGPFGTTIAHGYLTLSLSNYFLPQLIEVQGMNERLAKNFDRVDANADGELSRDELRAMHAKMRQHGRKAGRRMSYMQGLMKGMDDDGNGAISRAELGDKVPKLVENFAAIDTDGNNELSREEMRAFHQARRAERRAQKAD